jgi:hypothetical protein
MKSLDMQEDARPIARVYFAGEDSPYPGWFVQRYVGLDLLTTRLPLSNGADALDAVSRAADFLLCRRDQIQVEGSAWPKTAKST